jgi:diguanylate cyclase (GGDEF)-like protein
LSCGQGERKCGITVSIGLPCYKTSANVPNKTPEQWIQEADEALYRAKHLGKNRIAIHIADEPKTNSWIFMVLLLSAG